MSTKEPTKMTPPLTVEEIKRRRQDRLAAAVTPQGCGSGGWREHLASQPSDFPLQPCDLKKWLKYVSLPIERACFVLFGFEPPPLHVLRFVQDNYNPSREPTWEAPPEYNDFLASLRVSIAYGNVPIHKIRESQYETRQVSWPDLVRWARSKDYPIAPELGTLVAKMEPAPVAGAVRPTAPVVASGTAAPAHETAASEVARASDGDNIEADWRNSVRAEAWEQWVKTLAENGTPTLENVSKHLAAWCKKEGIRGNLGKFPQASYLQQHVIDGKHWGPPRNMSRDKAKEHIEQKKQEKQAKKNK